MEDPSLLESGIKDTASCLLFCIIMKALYIVGDKIFNPSKTLYVQRDICVFYMNKLEFTKVFQDNMLSAFKFYIN